MNSEKEESPVDSQQKPHAFNAVANPAQFDPQAVLDFWFGDGALDDADYVDARMDLWFKTDFDFDAEVRVRFEGLVEYARAGGCNEWVTAPRHAVALVIVLDQMPRNIYRGKAAAFASDATAREISSRILGSDGESDLSLIERVFLYMPFEHAEDLALQEQCVSGYESLQETAPPSFKALMEACVEAGVEHRAVIRRFGRFPHRNPILERASTSQELAWAKGHHGWGQGEAVITRGDVST